MRRNGNNKWIVINDVHYDYTHRKEDHLYRPWNAEHGLNCTQWRKDLILQRPKIVGHKNSRLMKDMVYKTWINEHVEKHGITGNYLGLAAAYTPEIFTNFFPHIATQFVNCQIHKKDYNKLVKYQEHINKAYSISQYGVNFRLYRENILKHMRLCSYEYSFFDLDFMCSLDPYLVDEITTGLWVQANHGGKSTVAVWHSTNRKYGEVFVEACRRSLRKKIKLEFNILKDTKINYYEGYPMRVDIFTLQRKAA